MSELRYLPISFLDKNIFLPLMNEEEEAWISDLGWDYSPIQRILVSFINQKLLPGYGALSRQELLGYTYFLVNQSKGIIGSIYSARLGPSQEIVENLLSLAISSLKENPRIKRVEAQIMPFNGVNLTGTFTEHGFAYYPRCYLDLDLKEFKPTMTAANEKLVAWDSTKLHLAAEMTSISYRGQMDAVICEDYRSAEGCESYLRSLVENPGCGTFVPETSFMCLEGGRTLCGFVMGCRISSGVGMIPQIAVHPSFQGHGLGDALIRRSLEQFRSLGFNTVSLTVTKKNRRAFDWYQRLGFEIRKDFGAYIWQR